MKYNHLKSGCFCLVLCFAFLLAGCNGNTDTADSLNATSSDTTPAPDPMSFQALFPDPGMANYVAQIFQKKVSDVTSYDELASYTGELSCGIQDPEIVDLTGIGYLTGVTSFSCFKNGVRELPAEIGNLKALKSINCLKAFSLEKIPAEIGSLKNLESLRFALTELESLPEEICQLENLKELDISSTKVTSIPEKIGDLRNLEKLDIHNIAIAELPESICRLTKVKSLDISHTQIQGLPEDFGNMTSLESLNLSNCKLKELPVSIGNLERLTYINVYDNFDLDESYRAYLRPSVKVDG